MIRLWAAAIFLLTTPIHADEQPPAPKDTTDVSVLLSGDKKPCDADKKKAEVEAKKNETALQGLLGTDKKTESAPKTLGAVPAMGNCK